jgi:hypothetical protein
MGAPAALAAAPSIIASTRAFSENGLLAWLVDLA